MIRYGTFLLMMLLLLSCAATPERDQSYRLSRMISPLVIPQGLTAPSSSREMAVPTAPTIPANEEPAVLIMPPGFTVEK